MTKATNPSIADKLSILILWVVVLATAVGACIFLFNGNRFEGWVGVASLIVFVFVQVVLPFVASMRIPAFMRILISLVMLISLTIGRFFALYKRIEHFDKLQHGLYGIVIALIAVVMLFRLIPNSSRRNPELSSAAIGIFSVGATMILLFIWELFEYICDRLFLSDMQDWQAGGISGLTDTMFDLSVGFSGAIVASIVIMLLYRRNKEAFFLHYLAGFFPNTVHDEALEYDNREEAITE